MKTRVPHSRAAMACLRSLFLVPAILCLPTVAFAADEPSYRGLTKSQCLKTLKEDKSVPKRSEAVAALSLMMPRDRAMTDAVADALLHDKSPRVRLRTVRRRGGNPGNDRTRGENRRRGARKSAGCRQIGDRAPGGGRAASRTSSRATCAARACPGRIVAGRQVAARFAPRRPQRSPRPATTPTP